MSKSLAPRMPRGCSWMWLWLMLGGLLAPEVPAQPGGRTPTPKSKVADGSAPKSGTATGKSAPAPPKTGTAPTKPAVEPKNKGAAKGKAGDVVPEGVTPSPDTKKVEAPESFLDPRAKAAVANTFPQVGTRPNAQAISQVKAMARGENPPDPAVIRSFVDGMIYELSSKANIKALLETSEKPQGSAARGLEAATNNLIEPLTSARNNNNMAFLTAYNQVLVARLPLLLDKHLLSRIEAMIVLGNTRSPNAIDLYIKQLRNRDQTVWVKLWAARGLANVTQDGQIDLDAQRGMTAGKAVVDFLEQEKDLPWPVQVRALEALGALRQSSAAPLQGKADMASAALERLADPKARPEVRAWAAWALGLMRVNPQLAKYNYSLIAHSVGVLAADLGEKIAAVASENPEQAQFWSGLLLYQVYPSLSGQPGVRDSGLLNVPILGSHGPFIKQLNDRVQEVCVAAVTLIRAAGGQVPVKQKDLSIRVATLRAFLDKAVPADRRLLPGGTELPLANSRVAGAR